MPVIKGVTLTCKTILKSSLLQDINAEVAYKDKQYPYALEKIFVEEPNEAIRLQAQLQNANKKIFDLI